jgi:hypothetical protein
LNALSDNLDAWASAFLDALLAWAPVRPQEDTRYASREKGAGEVERRRRRQLPWWIREGSWDWEAARTRWGRRRSMAVAGGGSPAVLVGSNHEPSAVIKFIIGLVKMMKQMCQAQRVVWDGP